MFRLRTHSFLVLLAVVARAGDPETLLSMATAPPLRSGSGHTVFDPEGKPTGQVISACHSPTFGCPIALAYVRTPHATPGTQLTMTSEGESAICATVADLPFTA